MEIKFNSKLEEMRYYIEELLQDKELHTINEIKEYIVKNSSITKEDMKTRISSALRDLTRDNPVYTNPKRGVYQMDTSNDLMVLKVLQELLKARKEIEKVLSQVNVMELTESKFEEVKVSREALSDLNKTISKVKSN